MKKILATQRLIECDTYPETREALDIKWGEYFQFLGMLLTPMPVCGKVSDYISQMQIDGVVLTGGNDLSVFSSSEVNQKRDEFEKAVIRVCLDQKIPIIGVCRGLQILAHYFEMELAPVKDHAATAHEISIKEDSRFMGSFTATRTVNSYHHYGLKTVGEGFRAAASAQDSTLEAIEHEFLPIFAMMWHPERAKSFSEADREIFLRVFG